MKLSESVILLSFLLMLSGCTRINNPIPDNENPLPECPESPNCARVGFETDQLPGTSYEALLQTLIEMGAEITLQDDEKGRIESVFTIPVFGFKDDVVAQVDSSADSTNIFLRSASREGYYDLGVNKRRVRNIYRIFSEKAGGE